MPYDEALPNCYLKVAMRNVNGTTTTKTLNLQVVKKILPDKTSKLTEIGTMIFGYENNFCMDLGTQEKYTVYIERDNPFPYDDDQNFDDSLWSNARWYDELESMVNFWQNFGRNPNNTSEWTGGMQFHYEPKGDDKKFFPTLDKNVFFLGSLNANFKVGKLSVTLPLQVGTMKTKVTSYNPITLTFIDGPSGTAPTTENSFTETSFVGVPIYAPEPLPAWAGRHGPQRMLAWVFDGTKSWIVGTSMTFNVRTTFYTQWVNPIATWDYVNRGIGQTTEELVPPAGARYMRVWMVGGGGGGGSGSTAYLGGRNGGGGGGSGEAIIGQTFIISADDRIKIYVGKGGNTGRDGESSKVWLNEQLIEAHGGLAGKSPGSDVPYLYGGAEGGAKYSRGGHAGGFHLDEDMDMRDGHDGFNPLVTYDPSGEIDFGGHGSKYYIRSDTLAVMGSGGGGVAEFFIYRPTIEAPETEHLVYSIGGNANSSGNGESGTHGGGGGGSSMGSGGKGGDGSVYIAFYGE